MLKFGTVTNINPLTAKARVEFADDNMTSYWLPILQKKTLKDKYYSVVDVGEQVACLMDENCEEGVILGAIYTSLDRENEMLTVVAKTINLIGDVVHTGKLENTDGITSNSDITDKTSSMQAIRDTYNSHTHTGNQGSPTSKPKEAM